MSQRPSILYVRRRASLILLGSVLASTTLGQGLQAPLMMAPLQQMKDEFGQVLEGHARAPGDLIITYQTTDGVIYPPDTNGVAHANNIAVPGGTSGMGALTPRSYLQPGVFNLVIMRNPNNQPYIQDGKKLFVRVFNAPTLEEASFYTDSQVVVPRGGKRFRLVFASPSTAQPLDSGDDDRDGLNNSYEKSLNTDPGNPDSDDDGMSDGDEFISGTDPGDEDSVLQITSMLEASGNEVFLSWQSVSGKTYHVQANAFLTDTNGFVNIPNCQATATSDVMRIVVPDQFLNNFYNYRVIVTPDL